MHHRSCSTQVPRTGSAVSHMARRMARARVDQVCSSRAADSGRSFQGMVQRAHRHVRHSAPPSIRASVTVVSPPPRRELPRIARTEGWAVEPCSSLFGHGGFGLKSRSSNRGEPGLLSRLSVGVWFLSPSVRTLTKCGMGLDSLGGAPQCER